VLFGCTGRVSFIVPATKHFFKTETAFIFSKCKKDRPERKTFRPVSF